jgi:beta-lactam-binding protein with PASTA domain
VDGASGWDLNDHIAGDDKQLCNPPGEVAECLIVGMELTAGTPPVAVPAKGVAGQVNFKGGSGAAKIAGLTQLMAAFGPPGDLNSPAIPGVKGVGFMGGNILLGGNGSDLLEGKGGDDLIDGDVWLNVQLRAVLNDGTVKLVDSPVALVDDVFADPQRLNPGNISIIRSIVTPVVPPPDCGAVAPLNCDTAVYANPRDEYDIFLNPNGTVTIFDNPLKAKGFHLSTGTDTLRNIELLQFSDMTIPVPRPFATVPAVIGLTQAAASAAIVAASLTVGVVSTAESATIPIGRVITSNPRPGVTLTPGAPVDLVVSIGTTVPAIVGLLEAVALNSITEAGLVVGTVTTVVNPTVLAGTVVAQAPAALTIVDVGTAVNYTRTTGGTAVPSVLEFPQALAASTITGAGLTVGTITFAANPNIPAGSVISQSPVGGTVVATGSAVNLVVSTGVPATITGSFTRTKSAQTTTTVSPLLPAQPANTLLVAFVSTDAPDPCCAPNTVVNSVTNSSGALTWTRAVRSNVQLGTAEVWWAFSPAAHAPMLVTATTNNAVASQLVVMTFTGAASSLVGAASLAANSASGAPSAVLTTTRADSYVIAVGTDWDAPRVMTPAAGQTIVNQFNPLVGDTYWVQRTTTPVALPGSNITISDTYGAVMPDRWNLALIEIRRAIP